MHPPFVSWRFFLVTNQRLYKPLCLSVRQWVRPSQLAIGDCDSARVAVNPALFCGQRQLVYSNLSFHLSRILVLNDDIVPAAPTRLSRQRSRPLVTLPEGSNNASVAAPPSLDGTFNVNSIEDDPSDPPPKTKPGFMKGY